VSALGYGNQNIFPLRISKMDRKTNGVRTVNLLLLEEKYYVLIKNLSRFLSSQTSKHNHKNFFLRCLNHFSKKELLEKHLEYCQNLEMVKIKMPIKGTRSSILEFQNQKHLMRVPITVCADLERFTEKN